MPVEQKYQHQPVLLTEALTGLNVQPDGIYVDGTFGRGGHARAILNQLSDSGRLFVFDRDAEAIGIARQWANTDQRITVVHESFAQMAQRLSNWQGKINGILLDLGVSSPQLDQPERGFSFLHDGPLDMRMDQRQKLTAEQWVATTSESEMIKTFKEYGEERYSRRITHAILSARKQAPITRTRQLAEIIAKAHPRWEKHKHPATRIFQALRIAVNDELNQLRQALEQGVNLLTAGGRLVVISFHSLEDRVVKQVIQQGITGGKSIRGMPFTLGEPRLKRVGKAIKPSDNEINHNPRARSAVLRIAEKIA